MSSLKFAALLAVIACSASMSGCGKKAPAATAEAAPAMVGHPIAATDDPCAYLEQKEVETVLGKPLAVPPFRVDSGVKMPTAEGNTCRYMTADYHHIDVEYTAEGGGAMLEKIGKYLGAFNVKAKGVLQLTEGSDQVGEWDEARIIGCCAFWALRGDSLAAIDLGGANLGIEQAGALANAVLKRSEHPLSISGAAAVNAAMALEQRRAKHGDACSVVSSADIDSIMGATTAPAQIFNNGAVCNFHYKAAAGGEHVLAMQVDWRNGYAEFHQGNKMMGSLLGAAAAIDGGDHPGLAQTAGIAGPWDEAVASFTQFAAVKNDVQIKVMLPSTHGQDKVQALVAKAFANIAAGS